MSNLLKEVLRTLCGDNQWSYAVFWKIGCHNPKLLIWEECYFGPASSSVLPPNSVAENSDLPVSDRQQYWGSDVHSSLGIQARDGVHLLINKMMISNQVNVIGEGLVGRAAFTGNHEWILASRYSGDVHPPEVSNEVHNQFSAGIQTVAVVPVFPHGVAQFGSLLPIMENMGFVNNVKSLILQLGCIPGVLLSDDYSVKESMERIGVPISLGMPFPVHLMNSTPLLVDGYSQLGFSSQTSRSVGQPSHSQCEQTRDNAQLADSAFHMPNMTHYMAKPHDGRSEMESIPLMKSGDLFEGNRQNGVVGAQVIPSNPYMFLNQHAASQNSRPGFSHWPITSQSDSKNSILKLLQQQIALDAAVQNHDCDNEGALQRFTMPHITTNGNPHLIEGSLTSGNELPNRISGHTRLSPIPCSVSNPQNMVDVTFLSAHPARLGPQSFLSSRAEEVPSCTLGDQVSGSDMVPSSSDNKNIYSDMKHSENEFSASKERMDNDPFQAFSNKLSSQPDECVTLSEHSPSSRRDCLDYESGICGTIAANANYKGSLAQPLSGDDLYDILGMDLKNQLLSGKWNNVLEDGPYPKAQITVKETSTFKNMQEVNPYVNSVNEESGIFSATDTDNLLDAMVSSAHSAAMQRLDDNISCRTTLMKTDISSVPSDSLARGHVNVSDQPRKGLFDLPKLWEKAGAEASGSLISGCTKNGVKSCSQSNSMYGSQLSSWVEQAHNVRRESSAVTAFSKKSDEVSKPNRKRLKPGENPRPRPKDRQMIQDRVKELREIVPNGAKCSIDALLERTIKHMLFLQSVTKHADKLKQTGESKLINKEGGVLLKDNFEGGATWAYKVGSKSMVCPIIVEDLNPPRQMLVEMLCEEHGFFLEIADLIRGLGLTILKGMMEAQNDKIWARFAVEADRDVTRMEVFMSLVRLLEQTTKGSPSAVNALEKNLMNHLAFPQTASMPATGRRSNLQ